MKILLYKPGTSDSFRLYTNPYDAVIDMEKMIVSIKVRGGTDVWKLVKRHDLLWSDATKNCAEILVKLDVEEPDDV